MQSNTGKRRSIQSPHPLAARRVRAPGHAARRRVRQTCIVRRLPLRR